MNIYTKILLVVLPLVFLNFITAVGTTYYFSHKAILELAETWLETRLSEAVKIVEEQDKSLHTYGLNKIPASITKAKLDAETAIAQIEVGESGYIFAIDANGTMTMHPDDTQLATDITDSDELYQRTKRGDKHLNLVFNGEKHLAVYGFFPPWDWTLIVIAPEHETFKFINRMKPYLLSFGLVGTFLVALILMIISRKITEPLRSLTSGVENVRGGDLTTRIPIQSDDEIGILSRGFNEMAQQIHNSHLELEQRVVERTEELTQANKELLQNIEARNRAVEAWKINERRIAAILRASPIGICLVVDRVFSWANDAMYSILGYEKGTLIDQKSKILYYSDEEYNKMGAVFYKNNYQKGIVKAETRFVKKDGTLINCSLQACPLDSSDLSKGLIVAVADITMAKRLEEKLQRAKKMEAIGTLAGGVAHDLNNILSGIVSYPELLLLDIHDDSPLKKPLETIKQSGERATAIVQDLLTMARRGVAVTEIINLNEVIGKQLEGPEIRQLIDLYPGVEIIDVLEDSLDKVSGSGAHLSKTLFNLVSNAAEAMLDGGQIRISTENVYVESDYRGYELINKGRYVMLSVEDNGVGIAKAVLERIFEPFYTRKQMGRSGTGLGMAVVWGTVKDHDGFIDIESEENMGTTFRLFFPSSDEPVTVKRSPDPIDMFMGAGERVLIVDDSELQREIAGKILTKLNYESIAVSSGEEAVEYLITNKADLLILDMIMPDGIDGLDTYKEIRNFKPKQKIIITSGFSETDRVKEIQNLSSGQYLKKPYTIEKLGKAISMELRTA